MTQQPGYLRLFQMPELLQRFVAWLMNRVGVNQTVRGIRSGVPVFTKRRRAGGRLVIWFGNQFLALARSGVCMFVRADEWMEWEAYCSSIRQTEPRLMRLREMLNQMTAVAGN